MLFYGKNESYRLEKSKNRIIYIFTTLRLAFLTKVSLEEIPPSLHIYAIVSQKLRSSILVSAVELRVGGRLRTLHPLQTYYRGVCHNLFRNLQ